MRSVSSTLHSVVSLRHFWVSPMRGVDLEAPFYLTILHTKSLTKKGRTVGGLGLWDVGSLGWRCFSLFFFGWRFEDEKQKPSVCAQKACLLEMR